MQDSCLNMELTERVMGPKGGYGGGDILTSILLAFKQKCVIAVYSIRCFNSISLLFNNSLNLNAKNPYNPSWEKIIIY